MTAKFHTIADLLALGCAALPASERSLRRHAKSYWQTDPKKARKRPGRGGEWEYHTSLLPQATQLRLLARAQDDTPAAKTEDGLWAAFEGACKAHKTTAQERLDTLQQIAAVREATGATETSATRLVAQQRGVAVSSISNWKKAVRGLDRHNWLPALLPSYKATAQRAQCHPDAWDYIVSDMLRPEKPTFTKCYRRLLDAASAHGWKPVPQERALRRRYDTDVPEAVKLLAREGRKAARNLIPAQRRTVAGLHAMQAVNMDGHTFDVFVNWPGHEQPIRPTLIAIQDVYSRKIVAWRVSDSENKETVALVIGDMVERYGIPEVMTLDNGRSFASKWITGRLPTRFRFKVRETDPQGLLVALGVNVHWATPGHGQAKPIERSFGDFATDAIARHPLCAGAYTGNAPHAKPDNYGARAMDQEPFLALVEREIAAHNARQGRRTEMAKAEGLSFDAVFDRSYANAIIRWPTAAQKALWLCAAERVRCRKGSGEIHFEGNRYWHQMLNQYAGHLVTLRFDPDNLHQPMRVYDGEDRLICHADLIEDRGFYSRSAARETARDVKHLNRALADQKRLIAKLNPDQLAELALTDDVRDAPTPAPKVKRLAAGGGGRPAPLPSPTVGPDAAAHINEDTFARGLKLIEGGLD